ATCGSVLRVHDPRGGEPRAAASAMDEGCEQEPRAFSCALTAIRCEAAAQIVGHVRRDDPWPFRSDVLDDHAVMLATSGDTRGSEHLPQTCEVPHLSAGGRDLPVV